MEPPSALATMWSSVTSPLSGSPHNPQAPPYRSTTAARRRALTFGVMLAMRQSYNGERGERFVGALLLLPVAQLRPIMTRDARLHGLTSDHHHALVLARRVAREHAVGGAELVHAVCEAFERELAPHFAVEEEVLLPARAEVGASDLAERTREEHAMLRGHLAAAEAGDAGRLADFAALLERHVHFEENELFPATEARLFFPPPWGAVPLIDGAGQEAGCGAQPLRSGLRIHPLTPRMNCQTSSSVGRA